MRVKFWGVRGSLPAPIPPTEIEHKIVTALRGAGGVDLDYWARKIGEDMYLVGWHDEMFSNVFSMVFDLKNKVDYTNAIMFYGTDSQNIFWTDSVIEKVTPIE